ncbi:FAD-dependent oxidoreductase [Luteolibacter sp. SL250]|uniref:FAD-dependent oxidoreductase n=1 Tax=Luteolibacter sp. SL250 TaxID=2995170 RepID=UPI00226F37F6|nr:FAD-dependent oxidoreductase [Luteolibacter sp. SL250]WAC18035.1 FAD-dependent oxidoreductase [Luteolibacter sp. SL250]
MLRSRFLSALSFLLCPAVHAADAHRADIIVYGESPSALGAALELADSRHDVLLVSPVAHVGGMMVEGLGHQDIDKRSGSGEPIGGLTAEFYKRIGDAYGAKKPRYHFEAKVAQRVIDGWLDEMKVRQIRGKRLAETPEAVAKKDGRITSLRLEDGTVIDGKVFIDGTVEGDLMAAAGVTYAWGREGNAAYGENVGGVLNPTHKDQYKVAVDPYVVPGDPSSGVIKGVSNEPVGTHGAADRSAMGFCLRLPLTKNPANKIPITAPPGYDPKDYEIYRRFLAAGGKNDWLDGPGRQNANPMQKLFDLGSWHDLSGNFYGRNHDYPTASHARRQEIYREHKEYTQGLIHFLSTDPSVPQEIRDEWSKWGLPADEFTDNGGWPRQLYIRCARRMVSDYVITEADVRRDPIGSVTPRPAVDDPIGICWWAVDLHNARTIIRDGKIYNEGAYFDLTNYRPFGVPYRSIVPKRAECSNLLVPSALSSSYAGYGAVRLEWTFMVLGQSAGAAAGLALDRDVSVQDVPYQDLKTRLIARAQKLAPQPVVAPEPVPAKD